MKKNVLAQVGVTAAAAAPAIDAGIQKKIRGSGITMLIILNEEMNDTIKIVKALEDYGILLKGVTKAIEDKTKEEKGGFLRMLWNTLAASLLWNMLAGIGILRKGYGNKGQGMVIAIYGSEIDF